MLVDSDDWTPGKIILPEIKIILNISTIGQLMYLQACASLTLPRSIFQRLPWRTPFQQKMVPAKHRHLEHCSKMRRHLADSNSSVSLSVELLMH